MSLSHLDLVLSEHANAFAAHHDGIEDAAGVYAGASKALFVAGLVLLAAAGVVLHRRRLPVAAALAALAAGVGLVAAAALARLVDRPRPFAAHSQVHAFLHHAADAGFPSDHATAAFAIAGVLVIRLGPRAAWALLAAAALAVSRVLVGLHYPGDVLAGALVGLAAAAIVCLVAQAGHLSRPPRGSAAP